MSVETPEGPPAEKEGGRRSTHSSGLLPIGRMIKAGAVFDLLGIVLCVGGVTLMANVVGLV